MSKWRWGFIVGARANMYKLEIGDWDMGSGMTKRKARPYKKTGIKAKPGTKAYFDEYYDRFRMKKPGRKRHGGPKR